LFACKSTMKLALKLFSVLRTFLVLSPSLAAATAIADADLHDEIISLGDPSKGKRTLYRTPDSERRFPIEDPSARPPKRRKATDLFSSVHFGSVMKIKANNEDMIPNEVGLNNVRSFTAITLPEDYSFVSPPNLQQKTAPEGNEFLNTLQGSYVCQSASLYRPSSVELEPQRQKNSQNVEGLGFTTTVLQPTVIPAKDEDFQLYSKCTVTDGTTLTSIKAHSCFYDICLGGTGNCLNVYAGGSFNFSPIPQANGRAIFANSQNNGFLDPTAGQQPNENEGPFNDRRDRDLQNQARGSGKITPVAGLEAVLGGTEDSFSIKDLRSALPPSFPGFCIGGTGRFEGIMCSVEIITIAQRSIIPISLETSAPTASPTETDEPTQQFNDFDRERRRNLFARDVVYGTKKKNEPTQQFNVGGFAAMKSRNGGERRRNLFARDVVYGTKKKNADDDEGNNAKMLVDDAAAAAAAASKDAQKERGEVDGGSPAAATAGVNDVNGWRHEGNGRRLQFTGISCTDNSACEGGLNFCTDIAPISDGGVGDECVSCIGGSCTNELINTTSCLDSCERSCSTDEDCNANEFCPEDGPRDFPVCVGCGVLELSGQTCQELFEGTFDILSCQFACESTPSPPSTGISCTDNFACEDGRNFCTDVSVFGGVGSECVSCFFGNERCDLDFINQSACSDSCERPCSTNEDCNAVGFCPEDSPREFPVCVGCGVLEDFEDQTCEELYEGDDIQKCQACGETTPPTPTPTTGPTTAKPTSEARAREDTDGNNGVIVQKIFISSSQRLPLGPRAIAGPDPTITKAS
jgi:hypothetical protein